MRGRSDLFWSNLPSTLSSSPWQETRISMEKRAVELRIKEGRDWREEAFGSAAKSHLEAHRPRRSFSHGESDSFELLFFSLQFALRI